MMHSRRRLGQASGECIPKCCPNFASLELLLYMACVCFFELELHRCDTGALSGKGTFLFTGETNQRSAVHIECVLSVFDAGNFYVVLPVPPVKLCITSGMRITPRGWSGIGWSWVPTILGAVCEKGLFNLSQMSLT